MVSPRALAVLRLMTSSNPVACSTGRSAGLAPSEKTGEQGAERPIYFGLLASLSPSGLPAALSLRVDAFMVIASLLIVFPSYVNQVGISLASPLTVRVVLAAGPVLIFCVQLIEGRLSASPYSLTAAILYAVVAISAGLARQRAIRSAFPL